MRVDIRQVRIAIYMTLWLIASGYAILRGGEPERAGAAILVWLTAGTFIFRPFVKMNLVDLDLGTFAVDLIALIALLVLALRANRSWPLWACSAQLIAVSAHLVRWVNLEIAPGAYATMIKAPSYIQCITLIIGTMAYQKALRRDGSVTSWRTS